MPMTKVNLESEASNSGGGLRAIRPGHAAGGWRPGPDGRRVQDASTEGMRPDLVDVVEACWLPLGADPCATRLLRLLAGVRLFQSLDEAVLRTLARGASLHVHEAGQLIFREGDMASSFLLVESGEVEVFRYSHSGEERVFQMFEAGRTVAEAAMFMPHGRYPMCARARSAVVLFRLRRESLLEACRSDPDLSMQMLAALSHALYKRVNQVDWISSSSAPERLANYLLGLESRQGRVVRLPMSQRQLAACLGIRAETLSRLFTDWQARGYVAGRRCEWELRDMAYLKELASPAQRSF